MTSISKTQDTLNNLNTLSRFSNTRLLGLNNKSYLIRLFPQCALSGLYFKHSSRQETDHGQMSTLLSCFVDASGTDGILMSLLLTVYISISYSYLVYPAAFSKTIEYTAV